MKAGVQVADCERRIVPEIPFSSDRKAMSVVVRVDDHNLVMHTKGAPEVVLGKCNRELYGREVRPMTDARRQEVLEAAHAMAERALREVKPAVGTARLRGSLRLQRTAPVPWPVAGLR